MDGGGRRAALAGLGRPRRPRRRAGERRAGELEASGAGSALDQLVSPGTAAVEVPAASRAVPGDGLFAVEPAEPPFPVRARLKDPPAAGLLFDVDSGEVLWARNPAAERPIASLTKIMTALVIAERHRAGERVLISEKAPGVEGSRIGLLKAGAKVPLGGALPRAADGLRQRRRRGARRARRRDSAALRGPDEPPGAAARPRLLALRRARRPPGHRQRVLRVRPRGDGAGGARRSLDRLDHPPERGRGALPGQGGHARRSPTTTTSCSAASPGSRGPG